ncbi:MAG: SDR family NAD(P)-dependent oxidoreductase [Flavobacteriales bacterium]
MKSPVRILVTGISKGIGKAIALDLIQRGFEVYGTARHPESIMDKIAGVTYLPLDLSDEVSIQQCFERLPELDVLINNAGQSQMGPAEEISNDKVREIFEVNFFGTLSLTKKILGVMRKRRSGKVINIGTLSGTFAMPFQSTYGSSKIALRIWTLCLRKEMRPFGVHVCTIEPFYINSGIQLEYLCQDDSEYKSTSDSVWKKRNENLSRAVPPDELVKTVHHILKSRDPKGMYISERKGRWFNFFGRFLSGTFIEKLACKTAGIKY